jgi:hypothetical protein
MALTEMIYKATCGFTPNVYKSFSVPLWRREIRKMLHGLAESLVVSPVTRN